MKQKLSKLLELLEQGKFEEEKTLRIYKILFAKQEVKKEEENQQYVQNQH